MNQNNNIIDQAIAICSEKKERLTEPRLEVLKIIIFSPGPLGAYEILEKLRKVITNPKPPTVYRAIDFWVQQEFIHRIESLNAYVACHASHRHEGSQFMICDDCGVVIESHICKIPKNLREVAKKNSFIPSKWNMEIHGLCEECQH